MSIAHRAMSILYIELNPMYELWSYHDNKMNPMYELWSCHDNGFIIDELCYIISSFIMTPNLRNQKDLRNQLGSSLVSKWQYFSANLSFEPNCSLAETLLGEFYPNEHVCRWWWRTAPKLHGDPKKISWGPNGDLISSEMGTQWGPWTAEMGTQSTYIWKIDRNEVIQILKLMHVVPSGGQFCK